MWGQREGCGTGHKQLSCHRRTVGFILNSQRGTVREVSLWFEWDYYKQQTTGETLGTSLGAS